MFVRFPHTELYAISKALGTVVGASSKNPITDYLVFTIDADTGKASVRCTNLDVIMSKSLSGVEVSGKGKLDFVPVEGKRFLSLLKHSDEAPVRLKLDAKNAIAEYSCGKLKSKIRLGFQDSSLFPRFEDTVEDGVVGAEPLKQALGFCQKLIGSDSYQILENTPNGLCAGSQSRFGVFSHDELAGMPLSIPAVVLKPLMAYLGLLEEDILTVESMGGFTILRHKEDPSDYLAFRRSLETLPNLSDTLTYPLDRYRDIIRVDKSQLDRVLRRVAIALEPGENRVNCSITSDNTAGMVITSKGSRKREASEVLEMSRRADVDTEFTINYLNVLTAIGLAQQDTVTLRVADNFVKLFETGDDYELQIILAVYSTGSPATNTPKDKDDEAEEEFEEDSIDDDLEDDEDDMEDDDLEDDEDDMDDLDEEEVEI